MDRPTRESRIFLSPPHQTGGELEGVREALASNYLAPLGPQNTAFEREFAQAVSRDFALVTSSGTAALHLALRVLGVGPGDTVVAPSFTFVASATPILQLGARSVFIDSERTSWNMDPALLEEALDSLTSRGERVGAVVLVDLYGQCADYDRIGSICEARQVPLVVDSAEALGATHGSGQPAGSIGQMAIFSFNGNKMITTSGGGMLVSDDEQLIESARKLSQQAREPVPWYEHRELGYNYRMSNILAAIGSAQLRTLNERVSARRRIFDLYAEGFEDLESISLQPEAPWGRHCRWLTCALIDGEPSAEKLAWERLGPTLEARNIESRPLWKPLHLQPAFDGSEFWGEGVCEELFWGGCCLPSGSGMTRSEVERVIDGVRDALSGA